LIIQSHQPLAFLNGSFSGAQLHWRVIEKEAFPTMELIARLRDFLVAEQAFRIFTDHRNLMFVNPVTRSGHFRKQTADK
jgi:hypothetical protein